MRIFLDPGHGGKDFGAIYLGAQEKDIALQVSLFLVDILSRNGNQVVMSRVDDSYVSLSDRVHHANESKCGLFLSVHCNADRDADTPDSPVGRGFEVYHSPYSVLGEQFAQSIFRQMSRQTEIRPRGVKTAGFFVLKYTNMPAVLVELGFIDSDEDLSHLRNPGYQERVAQLIAQGLVF